MPIISMPVKINKAAVLRNLGYHDLKSGSVPPDILREVNSSVEQAPEIITPRICYERFEFTLDKKAKKVLLPDGNYFSGDYIVKNLSGAEHLIAAVATIGSGIDRKSMECFAVGDYMKGMIYNAIGDEALNFVCRKFWLDLVKKAKSEGCGITHRLSPGHNDWDIKDQAVVFELLDASSIGVTLNDSFMMNPVKSVSVIYGLGKGMEISTVDHDCIDCELADCAYRLMPQKQHRVSVTAYGQKKEFTVPHGENLFNALTRSGIMVPNACGGRHTCGKCLVKIDSRRQIPVSPEEEHLLNKNAQNQGFRLACFCRVEQDMDVVISENSGKASIMTEEKSDRLVESLDSRVIKVELELSPPSLDDPRDDLTRLMEGIRESFDKRKSSYSNFLMAESTGINISGELIKKLPNILESNNYRVSCAIRRNKTDGANCEILSVERTGTSNKIYGMAVDIGTTTIAAYLFDLKQGKKLDIYSSLNPQRAYGADVISRINYTIEEKQGLEKLQDLMVKEFNNIIEAFCGKNGIDPVQIYEITVAGNSTMIHLFLGVPCQNIASAPYIPAFTKDMAVKARELGININPEGYIVTLPMVSGFVGADTVAAVLASRMDEKDEIGLLLDLGTNGEMVLGARGEFLSCSTAAGPAFEGAGITFGIGGIAGAIDRVNLEKKPVYTTIGGAPPVGICGSGVVDAVAQLLKYGIIDNTGRMKAKDDESISELFPELSARLKDYRGQRAFLLDEAAGIYVTQQDIRQIQLAKGAIRAGIEILMNQMSITPEKISKVYFAGGFGNYISVDSAAAIGLIPEELKDRVLQIGNGAGTGAIMALLSEKEMERARRIKEEIKYIELSRCPEFQEEFIDAMNF
ncbi:MAG TPA: DUF4445 domain-containing protein [Thermoanaerobacterales bacterium]|nr:DUF4445 domain-containing protein [Thermoanaerobacterales bacterium]